MSIEAADGRRRSPTDVIGLAPYGAHLARLSDDDDVRVLRWLVRAWSVDGRPMLYSQATGRLVVFEAIGLELHDDPPIESDLRFGCRACTAMQDRAQRALVDRALKLVDE